MIPIQLNPMGRCDLPSDLLPCDWLASGGAQYIDTGLSGDNSQRHSIEWEVNQPVNRSIVMFGGRWRYDQAAVSAAATTLGVGASFGNRFESFPVFDDRIKLTMSDTEVIVNAQKFSFEKEPAFTTPYSIHLFASREETGFFYGVGRIYRYIAEDTETGLLLRDIRPFFDTTANKPCMYCSAEKKRYYNQGAGEFTYQLTK